MFEKILRLGKGWREAKDPFIVNEKCEPVAPRHYEVAMKARNRENAQMGRTIIVPNPAEKELDSGISKVCIVIPSEYIKQIQDSAEDFSIKNNIKTTIKKEGSNLIIEVPVTNEEEYIELLKNKNFVQNNNVNGTDDKKYFEHTIPSEKKDGEEDRFPHSWSLK